LKKGFTLIELLVVIAVLAILVVITVPNIMKMYNNAKKNTFVTQVQNIYKAANNQNIMNELNGNKITRFYYAGGIEENSVNLEGNKKVYYDIETENGKIVRLTVSNEEYSIKIENVNGINIADITNEILKEKGDAEYIPVESGTTYEKEVYGVEFNLATGVYTRTDNAVGKTFTNNIDGTIISDFDTLQIYKEMIEVLEDGNVFIKVPKFYIKKIVNGDIWKYQISKEKKDNGYYLPACFVDENTGIEYPYILVGKYIASLDGTKLKSISGVMPLAETTIGDFRIYAKNNGSGYQLLDVHTIDALQALFYIEFATLDSTSIMKGYSSTSNTTVIVSGLTNTVSTLSGSPTSNTEGKYPMKYRGIENLWGNVRQFVDGINIRDGVAYVSKNANTYASDIFSGDYSALSYTNANSSGYGVKMGFDVNNPYIQIPIEIASVSDNCRYCDYYYQDIGDRVAMFGGSFSYSTHSGISFWHLRYPSTYTNLSVGARFIKIPL
jgi:prepilin-type N-terminal cleavage/methylation domain-containing protein